MSDQITYLYDVVYEELLLWQDEYKKKCLEFGATFDELGFEFLNAADHKGRYDIQPIDATTLQSNRAFLFNLRVVSGTLEVYNRRILKPAKIEIGKTIELIEKELNQK